MAVALIHEAEHRRSGRDRSRANRRRARMMKLPQSPALSPTQRLIVHPLLGPPGGLDVTQAVTRALAEELWRRFGGNDVLNWVEAERLVREELLALPSARSPAAQRLPPPRAADHFRDEAREPRAGAATHDT